MPNPIQVRLQTDHEKVKKLVTESGGTLQLIRAVGIPPTSYIMEYHCPGIAKDSYGNIINRNQHQVEIKLSANYPIEKPTAAFLTPIFNPHVFPSNVICLGGVRSPGETLDLLILRIGALIQLDPRVLDDKSPANSEANQCVRANRFRLPVGKITIKLQEQGKKRIEWS